MNNKGNGSIVPRANTSSVNEVVSFSLCLLHQKENKCTTFYYCSLFECFCISPEVEVAKHLLFGCGSSRRADGSFHSEQSFSVQHQPAKDFPYICTQAMIL